MNLFFFFSLFLFVLVGVRSQEDDPKFASAWNLHSQQAFLGGLNVLPAWDMGYTGEGIVLGYTFNAPLIEHAELIGRWENNGEEEQPPNQGKLKTGVISAAVGNAYNGFCSRGVAYDAKFSLLGGQETAFLLSFLLVRPAVDIYVVDFSGTDSGSHMRCSSCWERVESVADQGMVVVAQTGSGGPLDNCNYDQYANSPQMIGVSTHTADGLPSDFAETCAASLISGPGGTTSQGIWCGTDIGNCEQISGSQLAASQVAGVVALVKQADPSLTSREIAHILVDTADPVFIQTQRNGAGLSYHDQLGFGYVNAGAAVAMAAGETPRERFVDHGKMRSETLENVEIPSRGDVALPVDFDVPSNVLVDWVEIATDIMHDKAGDLRISLKSPMGTLSQLAFPRATVTTVQKKIMEVDVERPEFSVALSSLNSAGDRIPSAGDVGSQTFEDVIFMSISYETACCSSNWCQSTVSKNQAVAGAYYILLMPFTTLCTGKTSLENLLNSSKTTSQHPHMIIMEAAAINYGSVQALGADIPIFTVDHADYLHLVQEQAKNPGSVNIMQTYEKQDLSFADWRFSTTRHWNEPAVGRWNFFVSDEVPGDVGVVNSFTLTLHTIVPIPPSPSPTPTPSFIPTPTPVLVPTSPPVSVSPTPEPENPDLTPTPTATPTPIATFTPTPTPPPVSIPPTPSPVPTPTSQAQYEIRYGYSGLQIAGIVTGSVSGLIFLILMVYIILLCRHMSETTTVNAYEKALREEEEEEEEWEGEYGAPLNIEPEEEGDIELEDLQQERNIPEEPYHNPFHNQKQPTSAGGRGGGSGAAPPGRGGRGAIRGSVRPRGGARGPRGRGRYPSQPRAEAVAEYQPEVVHEPEDTPSAGNNTGNAPPGGMYY